MASRYPDKIDTDVQLPRVDDNITEIGGEAINGLRDSILALEQTLGTNPQGSAADVAARINGVIDSSGALRTSALSGKGLVTLPINNSHVGSTAGIQESKLDLDYSTADLYTSITTVSADLSSVLASHSSLSSKVNQHVLGTAYKHDGYDVVLDVEIKSQDTVEATLNVLNNELEAHRSANTAHTATSISVPDEFRNIHATNVQTALYELDYGSSNATASLQKDLGGSGIIYNGAAEVSTYGNLKNTTMAATIHETDTSTDATNILRVMRPNVARISGGEIDFQALRVGSADTLKVYAGGMDRAAVELSLTSVLPTDDVNDLVQAINYSAALENYPVSAYNIGGRLVLAHNIPGYEFTIEVQTASARSAHVALGFGETVDTTVTWAENKCGAYIQGQKFTDFSATVYQTITLALASATIDPGLGDLSLLGLDVTLGAGRILVNITNHSVDSDYNGTYNINSFPTNASFTLNETIPAGMFDLEVVKDSTNFPNSTRGELYDVFVEYDADGYGKVAVESRASYLTLSGADVTALSQDFPTNNVEWRITSTNYLQLLENTRAGEAVEIPSGFTGQLKAYSYDRLGSATFQVTGNPTSGTRSITVQDFAGSDSRLYICSVHYSGNTGIKEVKYATDRRKLGLTIDNYSHDTFENKTELEQVTDDLRNNGVVYGFEYLSHESNSITLSGGRAYVGGRKVETKTRVLAVSEFGFPSNLILLDKGGNFVIKNSLEPGFSFEELTAGDAYGDDQGLATILEYSANGSGFDGYFTDRRLILKNLDKRLINETENLSRRIDTLESAVSGSLWGITVSYSDDGYLAYIDGGNNFGFTALGESGFATGDSTITERKFDLDSELVKSQFKSTATTHINVFFAVEYTDWDGTSAFGTSGDAKIYGGVAITVAGVDYEDYALLKQIDTAVLPSASVVERYCVSVPVNLLYNDTHFFMDISPRIKITGSTYIDGGGPGLGTRPLLNFSDVRVVVSSYSIAGAINEDSTNEAQMAYMGNLL